MGSMENSLPAVANGLPNICGSETVIEQVLADSRKTKLYTPSSLTPFQDTRATFATLLHMHQPLVPSDGNDLKTAKIIGNLQNMMQNQGIGDNHNAPVFLQCYERMGDFIPQLVAEGHSPRITLEYSGTLLFGLQQMGAHESIEKLKRITCDPRYQQNVEWVGAPWGHAVAPSTPVQDFRLHVRAWQHHFAALFGKEALARVRGFSPSEMALPNNPDVAYEFVKTLKECGYKWVVVQEHTIETLNDGKPVENPHVPHKLVAQNSKGDFVSIVAVIKTQGSDTKLIGQMQPYYEAKSRGMSRLAGKEIPPLVTQIADGENGGVMMNEFPSKYIAVMAEASHTPVRPMNVTEYLEHLETLGVTEEDLPTVRPIMQGRIFKALPTEYTPEDVQKAIQHLKSTDHSFHMDGGSWTSDMSWVRGYENVLGPMEKLSALFEERVVKRASGRDDVSSSPAYQNSLFHLLCSQTSCYRYWGQGQWTDYGLEIIRRAREIIEHDLSSP